jgi:hypothetical protein
VHNFNWTGGLKNPGANQAMAPGTQMSIKDLKADRFPIKVACNIHTWMSGYVRVFDHPYFAVTDADGKFTIPKAPAGSYRLFVWHESVGFRGGVEGRNGTPVTIAAGQTTDLGKLDIQP